MLSLSHEGVEEPIFVHLKLITKKQKVVAWSLEGSNSIDACFFLWKQGKNYLSSVDKLLCGKKSRN